MPEQSHWPFSNGTDEHGSGSSRRERRAATRKRNAAELTAMRQRMRHDRLLVGGRAHERKKGLS